MSARLLARSLPFSARFQCGMTRMLAAIEAAGGSQLALVIVSPHAVHDLTAAAKAGDRLAHTLLTGIHHLLVLVREGSPEAGCAVCDIDIADAGEIACFALLHALPDQPARMLMHAVCHACDRRHGSAVGVAIRDRYLDGLGLDVGLVGRWLPPVVTRDAAA